MEDVIAMLDVIRASADKGEIMPATAAAWACVAEAYLRAFEAADFDRRLRALERAGRNPS